MKNKAVRATLHVAAVLALYAAAVVATAARAQSLAPDSAFSSGWTYEATPYIWFAGVKGETRVGTRLPAVEVDASFSDLASNLDMGLTGSMEARKGRWGMLFDLLYVNLSADAEPVLPDRSGENTADLKQLLLQLAVAYRVLDNGATSVDALFGARYSRGDVDVTLVPGVLRPFGSERSGNVGWTDAFAGTRITHKLSDRWSLVAYADVGSGESDSSWQFIAGANYRFSATMIGKLGYRALSMDYQQTQFAYDIKTSGIYAGLGFRF